MAAPEGLYGLLAEFENPADLVAGIRRARDEGYRRLDAYTPFPVEEVFDALHYHHTRMPLVIFLGGLTGCLGGAPSRSVELSHLTREQNREESPPQLHHGRSSVSTASTAGKVTSPKIRGRARDLRSQTFAQSIRIEGDVGEALRLGLRREGASQVSATRRALDSHRKVHILRAHCLSSGLRSASAHRRRHDRKELV